MRKLLIAVPSCWNYRDAWPAFNFFFKKFWHNCPFQRWLVVDKIEEGKGFDDDIFSGIYRSDLLGPEKWSQMLLSFLDFLEKQLDCSDTDILLMQEDFFLSAPARTEEIIKAHEYMQQKDGKMFRLYPSPGPDLPTEEQTYGMYGPNNDYLISCQASLWNREFLIEVLKGKRSAATFELLGTKQVKEMPSMPNLYGWRRNIHNWPLEYICTAIVRGKWLPGAIDHCKKHGFDLDTSHRQIMEL